MESLLVATESSSLVIPDFGGINTVLTPAKLCFLEKNNFLNVTRTVCGKRSCKQHLEFVPSKRNKADGYVARCSKHPRYIRSIREGSFFTKHKIAISKQLYIMDHLANKCNTGSIRGLLRKTIHRETVTKILWELQEKMLPIVYKNKPVFDECDYIEIDEMYIDWMLPNNLPLGPEIDPKLKGKFGFWI
jgi:hypothetical protein